MKPTAPASWIHNWTFIQDAPPENWQFKRLPGKDFHLDACINLDKLCDKPPVPNQSEGVLYADFSTSIEGITLIGMGCNWCFEAYCDGQLIKSTYETGNGQEYVFPSNHRLFFPTVPGNHLLAIRVRRGQSSWDFACGGVAPEPPPEPELTYGPWLTNPDVGRITVAFSCATPLGAAIEYRKVGEADWQTAWHHRQGQCLRRTYHAIALQNLEPGARYEYHILVIHPDKYLTIQLGDTHVFTAPDARKSTYSFFFTADLQFPLDRQHQIFGKLLEASHAQECDFFVLDGDVNSAFLPEDVIRGPFAQLCEYGAAEKPIIYVRGNHEMRGNYGDQFLDYFATNNGTSYDVARLGDTAFLLLDGWEDKPAKTPGHTYCQWNLDDIFLKQQAEWLKQAMADEKWTGAKRRIVICHGAAYSHYDSCLHMPFMLQDLTDRYFEGKHPQSTLNMWLTGHVHRYLRSIPSTNEIAAETMPHVPFKDGASYTYPVLTVGGPSHLKIQASCFRVDADADGFTVRAWDQEGNLLEDIRYDNDGTCTERKSFPHFAPAPVPVTVQNAAGYNSWPFVQTLGDKLVCAYSRGEKHSIDERCRGSYACVSSDGGRTWGPEATVVNTTDFCESLIGKGLDNDGALLLWVRCIGDYWHHDLFRSTDGVHYTKLASLRLDPMPMQITDVMSIPGVGLMCFWFSGHYRDLPENSWGTLVSTDNGHTWTQNVVEANLPKGEWPTEQSGIYLGDGRIFAIARCELGGDNPDKAQFQLQSTDYGKTWKKMKTNIHDIQLSTPSLIYNPETGMITNYYYYRGQGLLNRRVVSLKDIWNNPQSWPAPVVVALGSPDAHHAGNVNAVALDSHTHFCTYYTGNDSQTDVVVAQIQA